MVQDSSATPLLSAGYGNSNQRWGIPAYNPELDIVQFSCAIYYVSEEEKYLEIDVMRLGSFQGPCSCKWKTQDGSAKAGVKYEETSGEIKFNDGEIMKSIQVHVVDDDRWDTTQEFKVILFEAIGCELGQYLFEARVKIIDNDLFPSSKFEERMKAGELEEISGVMLLWEYFKLNFGVEGVAIRTIAVIFMGQLHNLYFLLTLYVQIYLVDTVLNTHNPATEERLLIPGDRIKTAYLCASAFTVPMVFLHYVDIKKIRMDLFGTSSAFLQQNLLRKYLNYNDDSRASISASAMSIAVMQETSEMAESGYCKAIEMLQIIGKLIIASYFILAENPRALPPIVIMPVLMICFACCRTKEVIERAEELADRHESIIALVHEACQNYGLIADYAQRPQMSDLFEDKIKELHNTEVPLKVVNKNNSYFPPYLAAMFTSVFIAMGAPEVLSGGLSLGAFLATIRIYGEVGEEFKEGFECMLEIVGCAGPLKKITKYMNMTTDLLDKKAVNRQRRADSTTEREKTMMEFRERKKWEAAQSQGSSASKGKVFATDLMKFKINDLSFRYAEDAPNVLQNVNVEVGQGKLVVVVGPHQGGKTTLLKLLSISIFPQKGSIFIPSHLRVLHVAQTPAVMKFTLWQNLTFGRASADPQRVRLILTQIGLAHLIDIINDELDEAQRANGDGQHSHDEESHGHHEDEGEEDELPAWMKSRTTTELALIHLARAFIVNPEVLIMQRPLIHFNKDKRDHMCDILREFVDNRGICLPAESLTRRRPRTLIFTASSKEEIPQLDNVVIWDVRDNDVREIKYARSADF